MTDEPRTPYFGPGYRRKPWEVQIDTPVGQLCGYCEEPVVAGDTGTMQGYCDMVDGELVARLRPTHYECSMRSVIGSVSHVRGTCSCYVAGSHEGDPPDVSRRDGAILAVAAWSEKQRHGPG